MAIQEFNCEDNMKISKLFFFCISYISTAHRYPFYLSVLLENTVYVYALHIHTQIHLWLHESNKRNGRLCFHILKKLVVNKHKSPKSRKKKKLKKTEEKNKS